MKFSLLFVAGVFLVLSLITKRTSCGCTHKGPYHPLTGSYTQDEARQACRDKGHELATIEDAEDQTAIEAALQPKEFRDTRYWLDGKYTAGNVHNWQWAGKGLVVYRNFQRGREFPDSSHKEDSCIMIRANPHDFKWAGVRCKTAAGALCV